MSVRRGIVAGGGMTEEPLEGVVGDAAVGGVEVRREEVLVWGSALTTPTILISSSLAPLLALPGEENEVGEENENEGSSSIFTRLCLVVVVVVAEGAGVAVPARPATAPGRTGPVAAKARVALSRKVSPTAFFWVGDGEGVTLPTDEAEALAFGILAGVEELVVKSITLAAPSCSSNQIKNGMSAIHCPANHEQMSLQVKYLP